MADNRRKFLGPNAGTLRDPTTNEKRHGKMANPPRMMEMGGWSNTRKGFQKNDKKIASPGASVE